MIILAVGDALCSLHNNLQQKLQATDQDTKVITALTRNEVYSAIKENRPDVVILSLSSVQEETADPTILHDLSAENLDSKFFACAPLPGSAQDLQTQDTAVGSVGVFDAQEIMNILGSRHLAKTNIFRSYLNEKMGTEFALGKSGFEKPQPAPVTQFTLG